jgi:SulP family sulfate permease
VVVYDISGALFFGAAQKAMGVLRTIGAQAHAVVLRMDEVTAMDATGLVALESAIEQLARQHCVAIVTGLRPQPRALLEKARFVKRNDVVVLDGIAEALQLADLARTPRRVEAD